MNYKIEFTLSGKKQDLDAFKKSSEKLLNSEKDRSSIRLNFFEDNVIIIAEANDLPALKAVYNLVMQLLILFEKIKNLEK